MDVIVTCQGGTYTKEIYADLRQAAWESLTRLVSFNSTARKNSWKITPFSTTNHQNQNIKNSLIIYL